jgi:hypothetical protein
MDLYSRFHIFPVLVPSYFAYETRTNYVIDFGNSNSVFIETDLPPFLFSIIQMDKPWTLWSLCKLAITYIKYNILIL